MKYKLIIVILISAMLITGSILELVYVNKGLDEFIERLDVLMEQEGEYSLQTSVETDAWLKKQHKKFEFIIPHYQLNDISIAYGEYLGAVIAQDYDSATALLHKVYENAERMKDMYSLTIQNVI